MYQDEHDILGEYLLLKKEQSSPSSLNVSWTQTLPGICMDHTLGFQCLGWGIRSALCQMRWCMLCYITPCDSDGQMWHVTAVIHWRGKCKRQLFSPNRGWRCISELPVEVKTTLMVKEEKSLIPWKNRKEKKKGVKCKQLNSFLPKVITAGITH